MGIDNNQLREIYQRLGNKYTAFADYIQQEFLPELREKYAKTYFDMFGKEMPAIVNYFPLIYDKSQIYQEVELNNSDMESMPSTMTGSLIDRVRNDKQLSLATNAFDALIGNLTQMERWNAYAPIRKRLNAVLSNTEVRELITANDPYSFGRFKEAARVAVQAKGAIADNTETALGKVNRRLAGGMISFRLNTALRQILSIPMYTAYSQDPRFTSRLAANFANPYWLYDNYRWSIENLPSFYERVQSGAMGDIKLLGESRKTVGQIMDAYTNIGMKPNRLVDAITVATGAKTIYEYSKAKFLRNGSSEQDAHRLALVEANSFNELQRTTNPSYLSPMQVSDHYLKRSFSTFQNEPFAYARIAFEGAIQLKRMFDNHIPQLQQEYVSQGMDEQAAYIRARNEVYASNRRALHNAFLGFWFSQQAWHLTQRALMGLGGFFLLNRAFFDDDEQENINAMRELVAFPLAGLAGGQVLQSLAGFGVSLATDTPIERSFLRTTAIHDRVRYPFFVFNEIQETFNAFQNTFLRDGYTLPGLAFESLMLGARLTGFNFNTWRNIYAGTQNLIRDGEFDAVDLMFLLNTPRSIRTDWAIKQIAEGNVTGSNIEYVRRSFDIPRTIGGTQLSAQQYSRILEDIALLNAGINRSKWDQLRRDARRERERVLGTPID